jgi:hypothetical protein
METVSPFDWLFSVSERKQILSPECPPFVENFVTKGSCYVPAISVAILLSVQWEDASYNEAFLSYCHNRGWIKEFLWRV